VAIEGWERWQRWERAVCIFFFFSLACFHARPLFIASFLYLSLSLLSPAVSPSFLRVADVMERSGGSGALWKELQCGWTLG